jgi:flavin reductase (DIM6/NTAB) family NADH-FMN oxidoreductase RutF
VTIDAASFKRALGQFATGITVVTSRDTDGRPLGLTVNAFSSVSLDPPLVLVCIDHRSGANHGIRDSGVFALSILSEQQEDWSRRFARPGPEKFQDVSFTMSRHGLLLVPGALVRMECAVRAAHLAGDHTIYVGEILDLEVKPGRPLVYHAGHYQRLDEAGTPTS